MRRGLPWLLLGGISSALHPGAAPMSTAAIITFVLIGLALIGWGIVGHGTLLRALAIGVGDLPPRLGVG